jgi:hypothetical protein
VAFLLQCPAQRDAMASPQAEKYFDELIAQAGVLQFALRSYPTLVHKEEVLSPAMMPAKAVIMSQKSLYGVIDIVDGWDIPEGCTHDKFQEILEQNYTEANWKKRPEELQPEDAEKAQRGGCYGTHPLRYLPFSRLYFIIRICFKFDFD